ncbi:hypothetical protein [Dehalogenimonas sp. 4OHTPN]|uniref:Uncharacterized protein n=1 Tax=Dehalogenimonas sp. 4OHTPN TaxID=3166643 RepID=A0AAU8G9Q7_9CHLR
MRLMSTCLPAARRFTGARCNVPTFRQKTIPPDQLFELPALQFNDVSRSAGICFRGVVGTVGRPFPMGNTSFWSVFTETIGSGTLRFTKRLQDGFNRGNQGSFMKPLKVLGKYQKTNRGGSESFQSFFTRLTTQDAQYYLTPSHAWTRVYPE